MSSIILPDASRFPPGTEVSAYETAPGQDSWHSCKQVAGKSVRTQPPGPPVATQIVGDHGTTFDGLERGRRYFLAATTDGEWLIVAATAS